jgi:hypothetical protein
METLLIVLAVLFLLGERARGPKVHYPASLVALTLQSEVWTMGLKSTVRRVSTVVLAGSIAIGIVGCIAEPYPVGRDDIRRDGRYEERGQGSYGERREGRRQPTSWYYCPSYRAYYPNVASCPVPWVPVSAAPEVQQAPLR